MKRPPRPEPLLGEPAAATTVRLERLRTTLAELVEATDAYLNRGPSSRRETRLSSAIAYARAVLRGEPA